MCEAILILQRGERRLRVDAARAGRQVDFDQVVTSEQNPRSAVALERDETGMVHGNQRGWDRSKLGQL